MADEPEGNLSGVAHPARKVVEGTAVDISAADFHPPGTVMDIHSETGAKVRYELTPQGWKLVKE
jgi:hypothetical protein